MKGIVNWYNDRNKRGLIERQARIIVAYEKIIQLVALLYAGDYGRYTIEQTATELIATKIKAIMK